MTMANVHIMEEGNNTRHQYTFRFMVLLYFETPTPPPPPQPKRNTVLIHLKLTNGYFDFEWCSIVATFSVRRRLESLRSCMFESSGTFKILLKGFCQLGT